MSLCNGAHSLPPHWDGGSLVTEGRTQPVVVPEHWYGPVLE